MSDVIYAVERNKDNPFYKKYLKLYPRGDFGGSSNYEDLENKPTINGVEISGNLDADTLGLAIPTPIETEMPASGGFLPNVYYDLGELTGTVTFTLATATQDLSVYAWSFDTTSTAPTITWPSNITAWQGGNAPTINASKHYEVSVVDGYGTCVEF